MIAAKQLKILVNKLPDDATIYGYEGEDVGMAINMPDGSFKWIRARDDEELDTYTEGFEHAPE